VLPVSAGARQPSPEAAERSSTTLRSSSCAERARLQPARAAVAGRAGANTSICSPLGFAGVQCQRQSAFQNAFQLDGVDNTSYSNSFPAASTCRSSSRR